jgi:EamA domain-containing membrane protein RarD
MARIAEILKSIPRVLLAVGLVALGLIALFVAWWIAVLLILGFALYVAVRRVLPRKPASGGAPAIIEGEFRIEREDSPSRDRSGL